MSAPANDETPLEFILIFVVCFSIGLDFFCSCSTDYFITAYA